MSVAPHAASFVYHIDTDDTLVCVDEPWLSFAQENDAPHLTVATVLHQPLWNYITDAETRHLYQALFTKVRTTATPIHLSFRCDSPAYRRFMAMDISHTTNGGIRFQTHIVKLEQRPPVLLLDTARRRSDDVLNICGWCKKVEIQPDQWVEVEEAVTRLNLFDSRALPQLSHGICDPCSEDGWLELAA